MSTQEGSMSTQAQAAVADSKLEAVYKKIGWRLLPFLLVCYAFAIIDRFNLGFAKLQFLQDLGLNNTIFGIAAGVFSVGYISSQVPSNLLLARIGVRRTLMQIMVAWGVVTALMMFANGANTFYTLRFILGLAEGGFFPGVLFYLTLWFPDRIRGRVTALFVMASPLSGTIGGPLAGLIMQHMQGFGGLKGWQWLFLLDGVPTVLIGIAAYFYLTDKPTTANWLTQDEQTYVQDQLDADRKGRPAKVDKSFKGALKDPIVYMMAVVYFSNFCALNTFDLWTPSLMKAVGMSLVNVGYVSGFTHLIGVIGMLLVGWSSDHFMERRWHVALCGLLGAACYLMLPLAGNSIPWIITILSIGAFGIYSVLALFWTIPSGYLEPGPARAGGIALITAIGSSGGVIAPPLFGYLVHQTGSYNMSFTLVGCLSTVGMLLLLLKAPRYKGPASRFAGKH